MTLMSERPPDHEIDFRVRYAETDQMGVVYHANYLIWCEIGRTELLRARGTSYAEIESDGVLLAVADASLRFHASARYDNHVLVETWVEEVRSRTVTFRYRISRLDPDGQRERLVSARTALVALDTAGRPRKLPESVLHLLRHAD